MHKMMSAIITPFTSENTVDYVALKDVLKLQEASNVDGLIVNGTTAEAPTLSLKEKREILDFVLNNTTGLTIYVGVSSNDTAKVLKEIENVDELDFEGYMICPPYYNKTTQRGLIAHFNEALKGTKKNLLLYNIPSRTGMNIDIDTIKELSQNKQVVGVKEASGDLNYLQCLINEVPHLEIYNGNDDLLLSCAAVGCDGIISAISNAIPKEMVDICTDISNNDFQSALKKYQEIYDLILTTYKEVNPIGVKALCSLNINSVSKEVRLPLVCASNEYLEELK